MHSSRPGAFAGSAKTMGVMIGRNGNVTAERKEAFPPLESVADVYIIYHVLLLEN